MNPSFCKPLRRSAITASLAVALGLAAPLVHADDFILDTALSDKDRCLSVGRNEIEIRPSRGSPFTRPVVWRTGEPSLEIGGSVTSFTVFGNVDLARSITLTGIPGAQVRELDRKGGAANNGRGCGARGSVTLQIAAPSHPSVPVRGRLRFTFPVGNPFDIAVVLQPVPAGMDLRWPTRAGGVGEHDACLRANGGHARVQGDTLEIGLNPDGPMPVGCDIYSLEVFALRDTRDVKTATSFSGSGSDGNLGVTQIVGLPSGQAFARPQSERLHALIDLVKRDRPASSSPFAALQMDYAAAASALRAPPAFADRAQLAATTRPTVRRIGGTAPPPAAPPEPRSIEFQVALSSFNNVAGLHAPMRVRLVETGETARSNLAADFSLRPVCNDLNAVSFFDNSTGSLAITSRELRTGDGRTIVLAANAREQQVRYAVAGRFNATLVVTDASGATRSVTQPVSIPRPACSGVSPPPPGFSVGRGDQPNLLPVKLFPERALLRRIGGLGNNTMVPIVFCSRMGLNEAREVDVPELLWGVSSAQANSPSVRVELRNAGTGSVLASFDSAPLTANSAAETNTNYPGRPAKVRVINVTGGDTMVEYGNQAACFLDKDFPAPALDPNFVLAVDTLGAVAEGPNARNAEADNELRF